MNGIFSVLQKIGRAFMLPIAVLPMAGILLGVGGAFTSGPLIETYNLTFLAPGTLANQFLVLCFKAGLFVFDANELVWKPAPFVEDENAPVNFPIPDANENVMLVAGGFGASIFDGKEWQRIAGDVTPLDRTRLYLMERQVEDLGTLRDIMKDLPKADQ